MDGHRSVLGHYRVTSAIALGAASRYWRIEDAI
jgi:hypothetical protein